jgi:hypothetical protein
MDPLIRNINGNDNIKKIRHPKLPDNTHTNAFGYADDISNLCNDDPVSIQEIFNEYEKLSRLSNLTLNADKTEIVQFINNKNTNTNQIARSDYPIHLPALRVLIRSALRAHINTKFPLGNSPISTDPQTANAVFCPKYLDKTYVINSMQSLKICGINFSNDTQLAYEKNVIEKIHKLKAQLDRWKQRNLTLMGKILIVNTFGISQIIYSMQCCEIEMTELNLIEKIIINFLWSKKSDKTKATERIKREHIYRDKLAGGLGAIRPKSLDMALKIRQVCRATTSNHPIKHLQGSHITPLMAEYENDEALTRKSKKYLTEIASAQLALDQENNKWVNNINLVELYDLIGHNGLSYVYAKQCKNHNLTTLAEIQETALNKNRKFHVKAKLAMQHATKNLPFVLKNVNLVARSKSIVTISSKVIKLDLTDTSTSKDIRMAIEHSIYESNKIYNPAIKFPEGIFLEDRLKVSYVNLNKITSTRLRNSAFKLIHGDIYPQARLKKFNLSDSDLCPRCNNTETKEHLVAGCPASEALWSKLMHIINHIHNTSLKPDLPTILNLNHNNNSLAITTVIAYFNHWNIYSKPDMITDTIVKSKLTQLLRLERGTVKNVKRYEKKWQKWFDYLELSST